MSGTAHTDRPNSIKVAGAGVAPPEVLRPTNLSSLGRRYAQTSTVAFRAGRTVGVALEVRERG